MYVINTDGFNNKDKIKISKDYILPELYDVFLLKDKIIFDDNILELIINNYTNNEKGVRKILKDVLKLFLVK